MEVLGGVVIGRNFGHVKDGAAPSDTPNHTLLRRLQHMLCDPFEDRQIMELVGVVLVVVGTPIVAIQCAAGPRILGHAHNGGVLIEKGCLLCERHPIQLIQKTLQLHITQKIVLQEVVDHHPSPHSEHKVIGVPIKGTQGLGGNHLLRLPNKGGCCPKRKKNHPLPRNNVGSGEIYHSRSHSLVGQRECMGSFFSGS